MGYDHNQLYYSTKLENLRVMQLLSVLYCLKCMQYKINVSSIACYATALWRWQHTIDRVFLLLWMHQEKWVKLTAIVWRKELVGIPKSNLPVYCRACVCLFVSHTCGMRAGVCMGRDSSTSKWCQYTNGDQPAVTWWGVLCVWGWNNVQGTENWYMHYIGFRYTHHF